MARWQYSPLDSSTKANPASSSFNPVGAFTDVNSVVVPIIEEHGKFVGNEVDAVLALLESDNPSGFADLLPKDENMLIGFRLDVGTTPPPATQGILMWGDWDVITGFTGIKVSIDTALNLVVDLAQGLSALQTVSVHDLTTLNNGGVIDVILDLEFPPSGADVLNVRTFDPKRRGIEELTVSPDLSLAGITNLGGLLPNNVAQISLGAWFDAAGEYTNFMSADFALSQINVAQFAETPPADITDVVDALIVSGLTLSGGVLEAAGLLVDSFFAVGGVGSDGGYLILPPDDPRGHAHQTPERGPYASK